MSLQHLARIFFIVNLFVRLGSIAHKICRASPRSSLVSLSSKDVPVEGSEWFHITAGDWAQISISDFWECMNIPIYPHSQKFMYLISLSEWIEKLREQPIRVSRGIRYTLDFWVNQQRKIRSTMQIRFSHSIWITRTLSSFHPQQCQVLCKKIAARQVPFSHKYPSN